MLSNAQEVPMAERPIYESENTQIVDREDLGVSHARRWALAVTPGVYALQFGEYAETDKGVEIRIWRGQVRELMLALEAPEPSDLYVDCACVRLTHCHIFSEAEFLALAIAGEPYGTPIRFEFHLPQAVVVEIRELLPTIGASTPW